MVLPGLNAQSVRTMTFNGATGLYTVPSGSIGWEKSTGLDLGYHGIFNRSPNHMANLNMSLFRWVEVSLAFDFQDDYITAGYLHNNNHDLIIGTKIQIPSFRNTFIGLGGNVQFLNLGEDQFSTNAQYNRFLGGYYTAGQIYAALTYKSTFFGTVTETSVALGKTFYKDMDSNIDFGMGFDLLLLPQYLGNFVHVIIDFSNFTYSDSPNPRISTARGVLSTGFRFDLSAIPPLKNFKFAIDAMITDGFDEGRAFAVGAVFGFPL
jgi:hypothetical protein